MRLDGGEPHEAFEYSPDRFGEIPVITYSPVETNIDDVMSMFGALPRDNTDKRLVEELLSRTGGWKSHLDGSRDFTFG